MIPATHIIGLTSRESGALLSTHRDLEARRVQYGHDIAARWQTIRAGGRLLARRYQRGWSYMRFIVPGRSFDYDELAEESDYVFLETQSRYMDYDPRAVWGWQFDAKQRVEVGALVCRRDLGGAFDEAIYQACVEVAATLPRLPRVDEVEVAALLGESDPALLAFVVEASTDPTDALHNAVRGREIDDPIAPDAIARARVLAVARCHVLKAAERVGGVAALELLQSGAYYEIVVPEHLPLAWAIATIEAGQIVVAADQEGYDEQHRSA